MHSVLRAHAGKEKLCRDSLLRVKDLTVQVTPGTTRGSRAAGAEVTMPVKAKSTRRKLKSISRFVSIFLEFKP